MIPDIMLLEWGEDLAKPQDIIGYAHKDNYNCWWLHPQYGALVSSDAYSAHVDLADWWIEREGLDAPEDDSYTPLYDQGWVRLILSTRTVCCELPESAAAWDEVKIKFLIDLLTQMLDAVEASGAEPTFYIDIHQLDGDVTSKEIKLWMKRRAASHCNQWYEERKEVFSNVQ